MKKSKILALLLAVIMLLTAGLAACAPSADEIAKAKGELDAFATELKGKTDYSTEQLAQLDEALAAAKTALDNAKDSDALAAAVTAGKAALSAVDAATEIAKARADAIKAIEAEVAQLDEKYDYTAANLTKRNDEVAKVKAAINAGLNQDAIDAASANGKAAINGIAHTVKEFTYQDTFVTAPSTWNPHTYRTTDDSYLIGYITNGLYSFYFNDTFNGYSIKPEMAEAEPVDITEEAKKEAKWGIPADATKGYAYKIALNRNAVWEDGTPINAETYMYSLKELLNPAAQNYRAQDAINGQLVYKNAEKYFRSDSPIYEAVVKYVDDKPVITDPDWATKDLWVSMTKYPTFGSYTFFDLEDYGASYVKDGVNIREKLTKLENMYGYFKLDDTNRADFEYCVGQYGSPFGMSPEQMLQPGNLREFYSLYKGMTEKFDFANVGMYQGKDEYELVIVLEKALSGFYLLYNLSSNNIVHKGLYEANKVVVGSTFSSTYNTSTDTTLSYGPYKLQRYQNSKEMYLVKNEKWYGWTDGKHTFIDPKGVEHEMYQATAVHAKLVAEASTRKEMFLKGQLDGYGLQKADFAEYRTSTRIYFTPSETIFFLILNGYTKALEARQNATPGVCRKIIAYKDFKMAMSLAYDKEAFAASISPARSGGYALIGDPYIYEPETGAQYRSTKQAMQVLCDFYGMEYGDGEAYATIEEAVAAITGYNPTLSKEYFLKAINEAIKNGDMVAGDRVEIVYAISSDSDFMTQTINYLNAGIKAVLAGTEYEDKITVVKSAPCGGQWSEKIRSGELDTVLGGWSGGLLDPFGMMDCYVNPAKQYDGKWFNANEVKLTLTLAGYTKDADGKDLPAGETISYNEGKPITLTLKQWSDCISGTAIEVTVGGTVEAPIKITLNFGYGMAPADARLDILAAIEGTVLQTYNYIPMLQDAGASLLSFKLEWIKQDYDAVMGRGGLTYARFNYSDKAWTAFVAAQGGELNYKSST
ncbi:MAG: ABC transporter substrate-binding protein [Clostridia bacterium]